jgi:periplasmic protein TonB
MKFLVRLLPFSVLCLLTIPAGLHAGNGQEVTPRAQSMPTVVREVKPDYTAEAKQRGIQGTVELSVVVNDDGTVGEVKVTRSLDDKYGLDEQAVMAMKKWQFKPGTKDGKPVAVEVTVEMSFKLK